MALSSALGLALAGLVATQAFGQPATLRTEKGSGLVVDFVPFPWRPDIFQSLEQGGTEARSWAFARLSASAYFVFDGVRLLPGHYAMVLHPKTGGLPMTLELRRVSRQEFLVEPPGMASPPVGESVSKRPVDWKAGEDPSPALDLTMADWPAGVRLTVRYGDRKLVKELPRYSPF